MSTNYIAAQAPATGSPAGTNAPAGSVAPPAGSLWRGRVVGIAHIVLAVRFGHVLMGPDHAGRCYWALKLESADAPVRSIPQVRQDLVPGCPFL